MTSNDRIEKIVTGDLGNAMKPAAMTPVAVRIPTCDAPTPVVSGEDRGLKSPPMTPVQPVNPTPAQAPAAPAQTPKQ
jgi:hypothetical protein